MQKKHPNRRNAPTKKKSVIELIAENPEGMGRFVFRCALSILVFAVAIRVVIYEDIGFGIVSTIIGSIGSLALNLNKLFNKQL